jgi:hypothetical protein
VRGISISSEPPFIEVVESYESRRSHAAMAGVMTISAVAAVLSPAAPAAFGVVFGVVGGYALNNWVSWDQMYDQPEGEGVTG